jgi:hypothetical protein
MSCSKDDDDTPIQLGGKYKLVMDGKTISEGSSEEIGMMGSSVSVSKGEDFGFLLANVPTTVGGEVILEESDSQSTISITGKNILLTNGADELYFAVSGIITRTSSSKISFSGKCAAMGSTEQHSFSGNVESDIFKII